jgi:uncharacterized protein
MKVVMASFFAALIFGIGLGISGMTSPQKVLGFLDVFGSWDPSLLFVMGGAVVVHGLAYRWILKRPKPLLEAEFRVPARKDVDLRLIAGAFIFGVGWGVGGFCPGPAIVTAASGQLPALVFVGSMCAGFYLFRVLDKLLKSRGI